MASGGRYIGSIYVAFDENGNPEFKTYNSEFSRKNVSEMKSDLCNIITDNLKTIPLETRMKIRKKHVQHALAFSCFKTFEQINDRIDRNLWMFQIYTKSIITNGPDYGWEYENGERVFNNEVKSSVKSAVNGMLEYLDRRYA
jgi:hypothetical protein